MSRRLSQTLKLSYNPPSKMQSELNSGTVIEEVLWKHKIPLHFPKFHSTVQNSTTD